VPVQATTGGNLKVSIEEADVSASGLAKAEDAVHSSGDVGVMSLGVRRDILTGSAGTDGDYAPYALTDDGAMWMHHAPNHIDSTNSTTTPLSSGAVFTGTGIDVTQYSNVAIGIYSSHDSATDGMAFQFSEDGTNWDFVHSFTYTAGSPRHFQFGAHVRYFRVVFTNGSTGQTAFRLQTLLMHGTPITSIHRMLDDISPDRSAQVVKSALFARQQGTGDFINITSSQFGALDVEPEQAVTLDTLDVTTGWSALGNDTLNLATTTNHVIGVAALTFDKVDGAANTVFAGIEKTITSVDLGAVSPHDILQTTMYVSSATAVNYVFIRAGTDSSNYNEWRVDGASLTAGDFETLALHLGGASFSGNTGNGWDSTAITYISIGVAFNAETDTLSGIIFDEFSFHTNQHTSTSINSEVTSSVSSSNVNIHKVGNKGVNTEAGNVSTGTQRITIATDDVNLAAMNTSLALIDDAIFADDAAFTLTSSKTMVGGAIRDDSLTTLTAAEGDVVPFRVSSTGQLHVTGAGGGTQYSVDDASPTVVTMAGAVRDDSLTTLTEVDGDATLLRVNSTGALHVTGGGGGTEYVADAAAPATPTGTATMMERDDALSTLTPIAGDWNHQRSNARGAMWVELDTTNELTVALSAVDNAVLDQIEVNTSYGEVVGGGVEATALRVTLASDSTGVLSVDDNGGSLTIDNAALSVVGAGTEAAAMRVTIANNSTGLLSVDDNGGSLTVDNAGTFAVQAGQAAHDAAISGNPVRIGATARNASATSVGNGDQVDLTADLEGKLATSPHAVKEDYLKGKTAAVTGTSDTSIIAAQGAGVRIYVTSVQIFNSHATVGTVVDLKDGSTSIWNGYAREDGGGCTATFPVPMQLTANTALNGANTTTGANTYFNAQGYKAA